MDGFFRSFSLSLSHSIFHLFVYFLSMVCLLVFFSSVCSSIGCIWLCWAVEFFSSQTQHQQFINCTWFLGEIVSFQCHFGLLLEMVNGFCVWNQLTRLVSNGQVICIVDLVLGMVYNNNNNILLLIWSMCGCVCVCVWPAYQNSEHAMYIFIHASRIALALWLYQFEPLMRVCTASIFITFQIQIVIYKRLPVAISAARHSQCPFICSCVKWRVNCGKLFYH